MRVIREYLLTQLLLPLLLSTDDGDSNGGVYGKRGINSFKQFPLILLKILIFEKLIKTLGFLRD